VLRFLPSWIQTELSQGHPIRIAAWSYLAGGLTGSLGLLLWQLISLLGRTGSGGNPIWVLAAAGLSVFGWRLVRRLAREDQPTRMTPRRPA